MEKASDLGGEEKGEQREGVEEAKEEIVGWEEEEDVAGEGGGGRARPVRREKRRMRESWPAAFTAEEFESIFDDVHRIEHDVAAADNAPIATTSSFQTSIPSSVENELTWPFTCSIGTVLRLSRARVGGRTMRRSYRARKLAITRTSNVSLAIVSGGLTNRREMRTHPSMPATRSWCGCSRMTLTCVTGEEILIAVCARTSSVIVSLRLTDSVVYDAVEAERTCSLVFASAPPPPLALRQSNPIHSPLLTPAQTIPPP